MPATRSSFLVWGIVGFMFRVVRVPFSVWLMPFVVFRTQRRTFLPDPQRCFRWELSFHDLLKLAESAFASTAVSAGGLLTALLNTAGANQKPDRGDS